jgi:hypothetical protein
LWLRHARTLRQRADARHASRLRGCGRPQARASIAAQALDLDVVDEVIISLVPVLMGRDPYFANLARAPSTGSTSPRS